MIVNDEAHVIEREHRIMEEQTRTIESMQRTIEQMQLDHHTRQMDYLSTTTRLRLLINTYNGFTRTEFESYIMNDLGVVNYYNSAFEDCAPDAMWDRFQTMCDEEELQRDITRAEFEQIVEDL
eukprot:14746404-Heterocapsa_arctica.AAC.1